MDPLLEQLRAALATLSSGPSSRLAVAYSGGLDSTVLLNALVRLAPTGALRALHVDHGLHPDSGRWAEHCRERALALGVACEVVRVTLGASARGGNIEARARKARYDALEARLTPGETLLTAHHADDQLETLLMRLVRGGGVAGLRGVLEHASFGAGFVARPLLAIPRREIRAAAERWGLDWLEDPANRDPRFDRSFLRRELLDAVYERWPAAQRAAVRTARQMRDAEEILAEVARRDLAGLEPCANIPQALLAELSAPRRRNLLRYLIAQHELPTPNAIQLAELEAALGVVRPDARTTVRWPGAEARIYGGALYLLRPLVASSAGLTAGTLAPGEPWRGPEGRLELVAAPAGAPGLTGALVERGLEVRFRRGGERLAAAGHRGKALKRFLQESRIVPWMRDRVPLLYSLERLVAVADLWYAPSAPTETGPRWHITWSEHPPLG